MGRCVAVLGVAALLCLPALARANGDPASDYLLVQSIFLPFDAKIDPNVTERLSNVVREADQASFRIKVALISTRYDLGTAFSLYNKPQRYAEFLGLELSFQYRDRLLVVMPRGFGYSISGNPDAQGIRTLKGLPASGADPTKQAEAATTAVRQLAAAAGHPLAALGGGGGSETRDRLTIAAAVTAFVALLAAVVLYRRRPAV